MTDFEQELRASLSRRVEGGVPPTSLDLATVRGRARRIERRRHGIVAGVAAAVAAVVVPGSLALAPAFERSDVPPAPQPTFTPAPTPDHALAGDASLDFRDLPTGPDPTIGYLDLSGQEPVVREPSGNETVLELENPTPFGYTALNDGRYVVLTRLDGGSWLVEVTDTSGTTQQVYETTDGLSVDPTHTQVAWASDEGEVMVLTAGVEEARVLAEVPGDGRVDVTDLDGTDCFATPEPGGEGTGCVVHVGTYTADGYPGPGYLVAGQEVVPLEGTTEEFLRHADSVTAGDPQETSWTSYSAGIRELVDQTNPCSEVYGVDEQSRESGVLFETCDHVPDAFSPDARSLLLWGTEDGGAHSRIGVVDMETRALRWERTATDPRMGRVAHAAWEGDGSLLASAFQGGRWQLVRFSADGAIERVSGQVLGDEVDAAFIPEAQHSAP
ncbi:hypothetical protein [Nocardioides solisilvae]|uniref:hypothetical protein n=1 Tax=Nocardioides solisilvae TaxID=1542435 RepID=UPI0013A55F37|nr:hypothetical protein [Nocardioides solisilvae]